MLTALTAGGFQIEFVSHAQAILNVDFPAALNELEQALAEATIPIERAAIVQRTKGRRNPLDFGDAFTAVFVSDKSGEATTHWRKLEDRVHRGVGNPCPLLLIGLPETVVTFHEGKAALAEVKAADAEEDPG
ncbi:MAG: hypothetical protein ABI224_16590 [Acetobacteraceae bacterium]